MKRIIYIFTPILCLITCSALSQSINKWTDEKGVVHYGDAPPTQKNVVITKVAESTNSKPSARKIDASFMYGRWQSEEFEAYSTKIPKQVYTFTATSQGNEGYSASMPIRAYKVNGNVITIEGGVTQDYTVVDNNTVSYMADGKKLFLHRL